jgi:hypothetical protein
LYPIAEWFNNIKKCVTIVVAHFFLLQRKGRFLRNLGKKLSSLALFTFREAEDYLE